MSYGKNIKVQIVGDGYEVLEEYRYWSEKYKKWLTIPKGMYSDGATCARDLEDTDAWLIHDHICRYARWDDGTPISNWQGSTVLSIELKKDGYWLESFTWKYATYLLGGGAARKVKHG